MEYCSKLYNHETQGDSSALVSQNSTNEDNFQILREEVDAAIRSLKKGKSAGIDNMTAELIQHRGQVVTDIFTRICNKIWQSGLHHGDNHSLSPSLKQAISNSAGEWPTPWRQSLIITLPKTGNLQQCQDYRTIRHLHKNMQQDLADRRVAYTMETITHYHPP